ncbi:hypothetical protein PC129_g9985 [Phytophthora cactorum]|uniref:Uncharacterized protein n=1 Tax=Phytophthora cactorum TaxID=29920 RepID=A0A329S5D7_9STRA|nr:hypothetical protein Pcac1_g8764 [Phytophthora cactorum]KAG2820007.1 hypothetical protein PC111_g11649 [Phytophthora cactorum]KAG2820667.1 hypothetical protein PC112_g11681 [Phytophthora cactorum]KAG2855368.1 hypothetical protein PC113_g12494 [Phytophthora cactorum]KAG2901100.1 hypothetical protein PC114_g13309 [Phytophthora cactorum]
MADVHLLFDQVMDANPIMASHLRLSANIVHTTVFEAVLVKICNDSKLTAGEARAVQRFVMVPKTSAGKRKEGQLRHRYPPRRKTAAEECIVGALLRFGQRGTSDL